MIIQELIITYKKYLKLVIVLSNQLKLYDTLITLRLSNKEKQMLKRNAYQKKITMSEYIRTLILLDNRLNSISNKLNKIDKDLKDVNLAKNYIGRGF